MEVNRMRWNWDSCKETFGVLLPSQLLLILEKPEELIIRPFTMMFFHQ